MSDDFIPLNQSTPVQNNWKRKNYNQRQNYQNSGFSNSQRNSFNNRWNHSRSRQSSSFGSDCSHGKDQSNIDAYLHPSMLQDPWAHLTQNRK